MKVNRKIYGQRTYLFPKGVNVVKKFTLSQVSEMRVVTRLWVK